ncbi:immune inhibitor A domain-containing protein [Intrasporangium calvum]|uniref:M6 family metalloprotease domain protein n=1 Tax=Intrasporangium calvum (strain ATCC 23552 / DSM 43043 / JCM 3097 / NBRC 12989 / NCIMB 10167 / NRRL B-3866 / 7 KIP) TaxID=710696 RepID=E6SF84_INTC7|nr:immune inhibitor A domain-containing protein [Intrasporangium calvum]ADU49898.1 M6 family metalloprotease domain protein [Intrasporangium calvum DSM 43043]
MNRLVRRALPLGVVLAVTAVAPVYAAGVTGPTGPGGTSGAAAGAAQGPNGESRSGPQRTDNRMDPLTSNQLELKQKALEARLSGKAKGKAYEAAKGQYVQLQREGEGALWTVLGEFDDLEHNQIPEPDRAVNNTTMWRTDFDRQSYVDLLFDDSKGANSMRNFYIEQSSNRYTVHGDVTDWIQVPGEAASYDDDIDNPAGGNAVWYFLEDSVNGWYDAQVAAGKTPAEINEYLSQFDVWDRYDYDGDGNFDEPDGYIDTFQSVHAGEGNEAGGGVLGDAAIWSHSWYAFYGDIGVTGPANNKLGGIQIGDSDIWVGKYTIQPENGGVGVFTHEYGHDLGLPDLYDTSGGENGTGFWTLMSSGSWMGDGTEDIGSKSSHMGAWEKFQLGWLNYEVARAGARSAHRMGPMEFNTRQAQGLFVVLPTKAVTEQIAEPYAGEKFYFSGSANNLNNKMYRTFTLPAGASLSAMVNYGIEEGYDYASVIVSTDGGTTWATVPTNLSNSSVKAGGIDGFSDGWVELTADLSAYSGDVLLGFGYNSDGGVNEAGFMVDEINVTGSPIDGAEADAGWTFNGFRITTGTESKEYSQYYVAEYRTYRGYDSTLKTGPYYFGYPDMPDYVDHFAYQDGLLINLWDTSQPDNNVSEHPGQGLLLPIDAHYQALYRVDNDVWRNRIQTYDATFTLAPTDGIPNIHHGGVLSPVSSLPAVPVFDDRTTYYDPANPGGSVMNPNTGTQIRIVKINPTGFMQVEVRPAK